MVKLVNLCRNRNNFESKYMSQRLQVHKSKYDNANDDVTTDDKNVCLNAVHYKSSDTLTALLEVNECKVRFQIDTGVRLNTFCQCYVGREQLHLTTKNFIMWTKTNMKPVGETALYVINPKFNTVHAKNFIIEKKMILIVYLVYRLSISKTLSRSWKIVLLPNLILLLMI